MADVRQIITRPWLWLLAAVPLFVAVRCWLLETPWNSDDMVYFEHAERLLTRQHIVFERLGPHASHLVLRFGLILPVAAAIAMFGHHWVAYYTVPILFSVAGFVLLAVIARKAMPGWAAAAVVCLHIVCPFEIRHASILFTDLPATVLCVGVLVLLVTLVEREDLTRKQAWLLSCGAAAALFWAFLMRANQPVLLAPALLVLVLQRRRLRWLVTTGLLFSALVLLVQLAYILRGGFFGYRWSTVAASQKHWVNFYPRYLPLDYLTHPFEFFLKDVGIVGLLFVLVGIAAQFYILWRGRSLILRTLAASGLFTFFLFSYYVYEIDDGKLVAFVSQHRFIQLFYYSCLVNLAAACVAVWEWIRLRAGRYGCAALAGASACLAIGIFVAFIVASASGRRAFSSANNYRTALRVVEAAARQTDRRPVPVGGPPSALRTPRLFSSIDSIEWRPSSYTELERAARDNELTVILRDLRRERADAAYASRERHYTAVAIAALEATLAETYEMAHRDTQFQIMVALPRAASDLPAIACDWGDEGAVENASSVIYPRDAAVSISRKESQATTLSHSLKEGHAYVFESPMAGFSVPPLSRPAERQLRGDTVYVVTVGLDLEEGRPTPSLWFLEYDDHGQRTNTSAVQARSRINHLRMRVSPTSRSFALAIRLSGDGTVRISSCRVRLATFQDL